MQANIIQIGNSKGLRLSKTILKKYDIQDRTRIVKISDELSNKETENIKQTINKTFVL